VISVGRAVEACPLQGSMFGEEPSGFGGDWLTSEEPALSLSTWKNMTCYRLPSLPVHAGNTLVLAQTRVTQRLFKEIRDLL
jgi:hypothetical protein